MTVRKNAFFVRKNELIVAHYRCQMVTVLA